MLKRMSPALLLALVLTACTPRFGLGIGGVVASDDTIAASEVYTDSESGVHGSISMGTTLGL